MRILFTTFFVFSLLTMSQAQTRARTLGIHVGVLPTGRHNAITDVGNVQVGHHTLREGQNIRTGVTVIVPDTGNLFQNKIPAAIFVANGFGKLAGSTQVQELGNLETPIALTNTLNVSTAMDALIEYTLNQPGNEKAQSVNALVGETNDGYLNDIRGRHLRKEHVWEALKNAKSGPVAEGCVGAGTGTVCFNFKGGIGTASRKFPAELGGYTLGVLVQTNFGGVLEINGAPVGKELKQYYLSEYFKDKADGSCMIVVATDAPLDSRNLERLAKRAFLGLGKTGGIASNGSGDYVIALSTAPETRVKHESKDLTQTVTVLRNDAMSGLFMAAIEATEEAILNSLFMATTTEGKDGHKIEAIPLDKVLPILRKYNLAKSE